MAIKIETVETTKVGRVAKEMKGFNFQGYNIFNNHKPHTKEKVQGVFFLLSSRRELGIYWYIVNHRQLGAYHRLGT